MDYLIHPNFRVCCACSLASLGFFLGAAFTLNGMEIVMLILVGVLCMVPATFYAYHQVRSLLYRHQYRAIAGDGSAAYNSISRANWDAYNEFQDVMRDLGTLIQLMGTSSQETRHISEHASMMLPKTAFSHKPDYTILSYNQQLIEISADIKTFLEEMQQKVRGINKKMMKHRNLLPYFRWYIAKTERKIKEHKQSLETFLPKSHIICQKVIKFLETYAERHSNKASSVPSLAHELADKSNLTPASNHLLPPQSVIEVGKGYTAALNKVIIKAPSIHDKNVEPSSVVTLR